MLQARKCTELAHARSKRYLLKTGTQPWNWRREGVKQKSSSCHEKKRHRKSCKLLEIVRQDSWIKHQKRAENSSTGTSLLLKAPSLNNTIIFISIVVYWNLLARLDGMMRILVKYWQSKHTVDKLSQCFGSRAARAADGCRVSTSQTDFTQSEGN